MFSEDSSAFGNDQWNDAPSNANNGADIDPNMETEHPSNSTTPTQATATPAQPPAPTPGPSWADYHAAITALANLQQQQVAIGQALHSLGEKIETLSAPPPSKPPPPPQPINDPNTPRGAPRFKEPRVFDGKAGSVEPFLNEIRGATHLQRATLPTDRDKSIYLSMYLGNGTPKMWFSNIEKDEDYQLDDYHGLIRRFRARFDESDLQRAMMDKIKALHQTGSAANYISNFIDLAQHVDYSETTKRDTLYEHFKPELKDLLVSIRGLKQLPFDEYCQEVIAADNDLHRRKRERQEERQNSNKPAKSSSSSSSSAPRTQTVPVPASRPSPAVVLPAGEPMEIDATKTGSRPRAPLTQDEKDRRRRDGLCSYCGQGKHFARDCPNMSADAKKRFQAKTSTSSSGKA